MSESHKILEKNISLMAVIIVIVVLVGGAVEILPLVFDDIVREPTEGIKPYPALQLAGRDVYVREGCYLCHSQMIRPFRDERERYGHYSLAVESKFDHPFQWGSKRTGPDLARVGGRYSDDWHRVHLTNPRDVVPESNMTSFPWLAENVLDGQLTPRKLKTMRILGVPYTDEDIAGATAAVQGKTELDALIAYLQNLGTVISSRR